MMRIWMSGKLQNIDLYIGKSTRKASVAEWIGGRSEISNSPICEDFGSIPIKLRYINHSIESYCYAKDS